MIHYSKDTPSYKKKTKDGDNIIYEYSDAHIQKRTENKADKVNKLKNNIDKIITKAKKDLDSKDSKTQLVSLAVLLMDHTYERVGNTGSADDGHYGVTTWEGKHIKFSKRKATLTYVGKSGVDHKKEVTDSKLVMTLKNLKKEVGDGPLFETENAIVRASDVNDYLSKYDVTAKDIRGYHANRLVQEELDKITPYKDDDKKKQETERKKQFKAVVEKAAEIVGHEPATLRGQYLAPSIEEDFLEKGKVTETVRANIGDHMNDLINKLAGSFRDIEEGFSDNPHVKDWKELVYLIKDIQTLKKKIDHLFFDIDSDGTKREIISSSDDLNGPWYSLTKSFTEFSEELNYFVDVVNTLDKRS